MTRTEREHIWRTHLARQRRSALSQAAYCRKHGLALASFAYWVRKQRSHTRPVVAAARLVPVRIVPEPALPREEYPSGVRLHAHGVAIELDPRFDTETLRRALSVLGGAGC
jgi:hypothetical protein